MKTIICLVAGLVFSLAEAAEPSVGVPKVSFQLEKGDTKETMLFVSMLSTVLTQQQKDLVKRGEPQLFCMPGKGPVMPDMIFDILNARYANQTISAKQAQGTVMVELKKRYPCN